MEPVDTIRFTENMTLSFSGVGRSQEDYFLPKPGELTSLEVRGRNGSGAIVSISLSNADHHREVARVALCPGDATFVDPGRWVEFSAGDVLAVRVDRRDPREPSSVEVKVELSYRVAA